MVFDIKDTVKRNVGETRLFRGRAEMNLRVNVETYQQAASLHNGEKTLAFIQNGQQITMSPATMRDILRWSEGFDHISGTYSAINPETEAITLSKIDIKK